jgi:hypothetical protein
MKLARMELIACCNLIVLFTCVACSQAASTPAGNAETANSSASARAGANADWTAHGVTACDKYLTPDFVGRIFKKPAGHAKKLSAQACSFETPDFASINITLIAAGLATFEAHQKYLTDPEPLSGVGDKAVRTVTGIEAIKGSNRMCDIDVVPPFAAKLQGEALAQKLGEVCNKLFALP